MIKSTDKRQCWFLLLLPLVNLIEAVWENEILKFNTTQVEKELDNLFNKSERKKERQRYDIIILILWNILNVIKIKSLALVIGSKAKANSWYRYEISISFWKVELKLSDEGRSMVVKTVEIIPIVVILIKPIKTSVLYHDNMIYGNFSI